MTFVDIFVLGARAFPMPTAQGHFAIMVLFATIFFKQRLRSRNVWINELGRGDWGDRSFYENL